MAPPAVPTSTAVPVKFEIGVNFPWAGKSEGWWLGPALWDESGIEVKPATPIWWLAEMKQDFATLASYNIRLVRIFLLASCQNVQPRITYSPGTLWGTKPNPWMPDEHQDPRFQEHFRALLQAAKDTGIRLIPCFLSFDVVYNQRYVVLTDQEAQRRMRDGLLVPFLNIAKDFRDTILCWDVINEPFWTLIAETDGRPTPGWPANKNPHILWEGTVNKAINYYAEAIKQANFKWTVGHRFDGQSGLPNGDIRQLHFYGNWPSEKVWGLPKGDAQTILGEFDIGIGTQAVGVDYWSQTLWGSGVQTPETITTRLKYIRQQGYGVALFWPNKTWDLSRLGEKVPLEYETQELQEISAFIKTL